jgi:uncharacterized membrane protein
VSEVEAPERRRSRLRLAAFMGVAGTIVGVFPGNVKVALHGGLEGARGLAGNPIAAWARLPLQLPLVTWAWRHTR